MALASFTLDPAATVQLTGDEIIVKINTDTVNPITRASSVDAAARPIETEEVTDVELAPTAVRDSLNAMGAVNRQFVKTKPSVGDYPVIAVKRTSTGLLAVEYDDVPIV